MKHLKKNIKTLVLTNGSSISVTTINYPKSHIKLNIDPRTNKFWKEGSLQIIDNLNKRVLDFTNKYKN